MSILLFCHVSCHKPLFITVSKTTCYESFIGKIILFVPRRTCPALPWTKMCSVLIFIFTCGCCLLQYTLCETILRIFTITERHISSLPSFAQYSTMITMLVSINYLVKSKPVTNFISLCIGSGPNLTPIKRSSMGLSIIWNSIEPLIAERSDFVLFFYYYHSFLFAWCSTMAFINLILISLIIILTFIIIF